MVGRGTGKEGVGAKAASGLVAWNAYRQEGGGGGAKAAIGLVAWNAYRQEEGRVKAGTVFGLLEGVQLGAGNKAGTGLVLVGRDTDRTRGQWFVLARWRYNGVHAGRKVEGWSWYGGG